MNILLKSSVGMLFAALTPALLTNLHTKVSQSH
jgi:hypothetical protein